jgi:hypothetical protein
MPRRKPRLLTPHEVLGSFPLWVEHSLKPSVQNVIELQRAKPQGLRNPILVFAVPRAMNHVVERAVLDVIQAWEIVNAELKKQRRRTLGVSHKDYRHLKRIRNKLVAHKVENSLRTPRHQTWYMRTYGSYEAVLGLVQRVADRVGERIKALEQAGHLTLKTTTAKITPRVAASDVDALFKALKAHEIY